MFRILAPLLALALLVQPARAELQRWTMDRAHSFVTFQGNHLGFSIVFGTFRDFSAEILFDPENIEASRVRIVIDAESVDTFWPARDNSLRSRQMLDTENFPEIIFESTRILQTSDNTADITGNITIKGVTREITVQAQLRKIGPSPFFPDQIVAGFGVTGMILRTDFGVSFAAPAIPPEIPFQVELEISPAG